MSYKLLITCEHGGNDIPAEFTNVIQPIPQEILMSHRGVDIGALGLAHYLAKMLKADFALYNTMTRLLIDFNRSLDNAQLYSEFSQSLSEIHKQSLLQSYWHYRQTIIDHIDRWCQQGFTVIHLSIHSFTPVWNGHTRAVDIGLLYDPARPLEAQFTENWYQALLTHTSWRVKHNEPYLGTDDGLTTALRQQFPNGYLGIELETNQTLWSKSNFARYHQELAASLRACHQFYL